MKKWLRVITVVSGVFGTLLLISDWLLKLVISSRFNMDLKGEAASVGIIGGADGPTAIFIATRNSDYVKYIIVAVLYIITAIGIKNWRKEDH